MPIRTEAVLVDANSMIEAHRVNAWNALAGAYRVETVEECFAETQTGAQNRRPEQTIDHVVLRASLEAVHPVGAKELADVYLRPLGAIMDKGEQHLWAHALTRQDAWIICGPDNASMRFGFENGFRERLRTLESLLEGAGCRPTTPLRGNYRRLWLERLIGEWTLDGLRKP